MIEVIIPQLGLTMEEAEFIEWHVAVGDPVTRGQIIALISTDKIDHELESPADGVVAELLATPGDVLPVRTVVARLQPA